MDGLFLLFKHFHRFSRLSSLFHLLNRNVSLQSIVLHFQRINEVFLNTALAHNRRGNLSTLRNHNHISAAHTPSFFIPCASGEKD